MIDYGPIYHPVIVLHYGLASGCCLVTVISPVVVTAVVAICSAVAQLLCPGLIAHCFSVSPHITVSQIAGHVYSVHVIKFVC